MAFKFNALTGNLDYYETAVAGSNLEFISLSTSIDYTIPTGKAFVGVDEFTVDGTATLSIEGTGRMILTTLGG